MIDSIPIPRQTGRQPARIAFVCTDPGIPVFGSKGASVHAQAVIKVLVDAGHEVHLITPRPGPCSDHQLAGSVYLHRLPETGRGPTAERERATQASDRQVAALLAEIQPDLIYERYALWGRTATTWAATHDRPSILEVNAPLITEQATYRELVDSDSAEAVACDVFGSAQLVSCVSVGVADWVRRLSSRSDTIMVLPNGVDTDRIRPSDQPIRSGSDTPFTLGFVGTLKPWHGVEMIIEALARCPQGGWRLLVVGDGPLASELAGLATRAGVRAEFTGAVDPKQVGDQLQRMDIACAPYPPSADHYFSPLKVYEYLAAGLPVIASAIGQLPDLLDHGRLGWLVPPGDPAALAVALSKLREDGVERKRLAAAARPAAEQHHTWTGVVADMLSAVGIDLGGPAAERSSRPEPMGAHR